MKEIKVMNKYFYEDKITRAIMHLDDLEVVLKSKNITKSYGLIILDKIRKILIIPKEEEY